MMDQEFNPFPLSGYETRLEREKQFDLKRTVIDIKINFEEKAIEGKVELDLRMNSLGQDHLDIDATEMDIYNVSVKGVPAQFKTYEDKIVVFGDFKASSDYILTITYKTVPRKGGFFVEDQGGLQFWTQGESTDSHAWFPCFDYPNMRSAYEIRVTVPTDYMVISNGRLVDRIDGDFSTFVFKEEFRFPAYLASVVAGKFKSLKQEWDGIPITSYFLPKYEGVAERTFINSPDIMEFISKKTGVRYPYSKYDQTCVSDFSMGGMENISATTLTDRTLHDEIAHLDYRSEPLICHEMAHQWFGDYVTCKDWSHAWLNEGFATFISTIYEERSGGKDDLLVAVENNKTVYLREFANDYGRPIVERKYMEPEEIFDRHLYQKASLFLRYLNHYLGDKIFWSGVKEYLEVNKMSGVSTDDFRKALSAVSGFSLESVFHEFLDEPGHPQIEVEETFARGKALIRIAQKGRVYNVRIPARLYTDDGVEDLEVNIDSEETQLEFERKRLKGFSLDPESVLPGTIMTKGPKESSRFILRNGRSIVERSRAAITLGKFGPSEIPFLSESFESEKFWYVKGKIAESVAKIGGRGASKAIAKMLEDSDYKVRREVVAAASYLNDKELLPKLEKMFEEEKGFALRANIMSCARTLGVEESKRLILRGLETESRDSVIRVAALKALGELADLSTMDLVKKYAVEEYDWQTRAAAVSAIANYYWKDRSLRDILVRSLEDKHSAVRLSAVKGIVETQDKQLISKINLYLANETVGSVRRSMRKALEFKGQGTTNELKALGDEVSKMKNRISDLEAKHSKGK